MIQVYIYDWENPGYIRFRLDLDFRFSILLGKIQLTKKYDSLMFWSDCQYGGMKNTLPKEKNPELLKSLNNCLEDPDKTWNIIKNDVDTSQASEGYYWNQVEIMGDQSYGIEESIPFTKEYFIYNLQLLKRMAELAIEHDLTIWGHGD